MEFLDIQDHQDLAHFLGKDYSSLARIIYKRSGRARYKTFQINKKNGGTRTIYSPRYDLKQIQSKLSNELYKIYRQRPSAHGFCKGKSVRSNADRHLDKKFIFNIDLKDFFDTIHFGRVKNLFTSQPFNFSHSVSTILAHICCFDNKLPQGSPCSPVISNMIAWKMDAQLQHLAKLKNCTYTRYVDDMSFSFTVSTKSKLPSEIIEFSDDVASPGDVLHQIIKDNGFKVNYEKVRLNDKNSRMEVTGVTVNEFPNVPRKYVRQIRSMLYAWEKFSLEKAQDHFNSRYDKRQRASEEPKSLAHVINGKIRYLQSIRGRRDRIVCDLQARFNKLIEGNKAFDSLSFDVYEEPKIETDASHAIWVIEGCFDDAEGEVHVAQGTGFLLEGEGLITCAHVVADKGIAFEGIEAFKVNEPTRKYPVTIKRLDEHRDLAICELDGLPLTERSNFLKRSTIVLKQRLKVLLIGFPNFKIGQKTPFICDAYIASLYAQSGIEKFEIDAQIREGNSGGPVITEDGGVIGIAVEGARKDSGTNAAVFVDELDNVPQFT